MKRVQINGRIWGLGVYVNLDPYRYVAVQIGPLWIIFVVSEPGAQVTKISEYFAPGLGIMSVNELSKRHVSVTIEMCREDLDRLAMELKPLSFCGECSTQYGDCISGDYICIECRASADNWDLEFDPNSIKDLPSV